MNPNQIASLLDNYPCGGIGYRKNSIIGSDPGSLQWLITHRERLKAIGAVGMLAFLFVQTYVDVTAHDVPLGSFFNGKPTELLDTRVFWALPLVYVAIRGPGRISIDRLLSRWWARR